MTIKPLQARNFNHQSNWAATSSDNIYVLLYAFLGNINKAHTNSASDSRYKEYFAFS
ncbi:MAG: hypothetical protein SWZ49_07020 [Cyanobacteriota bacterium]|nr:hypothetical protein [Cyanobacteriota bacterium]